MPCGRWWNERRLNNNFTNECSNSMGVGEGVKGPFFINVRNVENVVQDAE
jgi:hypothetical protein